MTCMLRALSLARRALGSVSPNPAVGAVVVKDGVVVGEGWTQPPGGDHAEIVALRQAGERAAGAVLYTTLEPCNHYGRTPPCTTAIVDAGIAEVHAAMLDSNPRVMGRGLALLQESGVLTVVGEGESEARKIVETHQKFITTGVPFVTAKFAMSLDGKLATRSGESKWITGDEARMYVHRLRAVTDAIMGGVNTVLTDDPMFTARDEAGAPLCRQPLRVVVDSRARTPPGARLLSEPGQALIAVGRAGPSGCAGLTAVGAEVVSVPAADGSVDLDGLMRHLGERQVTSVIVEGGGTLLGALFDKGLVDKVVAFVAPVILGGRQAPTPVAGEGVEKLSDALRLDRVEVECLGKDVAITGYR